MPRIPRMQGLRPLKEGLAMSHSCCTLLGSHIHQRATPGPEVLSAIGLDPISPVNISAGNRYTGTLWKNRIVSLATDKAGKATGQIMFTPAGPEVFSLMPPVPTTTPANPPKQPNTQPFGG